MALSASRLPCCTSALDRPRRRPYGGPCTAATLLLSLGWRVPRLTCVRSSSFEAGVSAELNQDSKFFPLNAEDPIFGPPALLLTGFEAKEAEKIRKLLKDLDGEFLKILYCTEDMISLTVWNAMHAEQPYLDDAKIAKSLPRICFLSGLTGEEMMMFIDAFPETGLEPAIFAALVTNSADKILADVIEEIKGDHEMLSGDKSN